VEIARLILEYVQALIWPTIAIFVVITFRKQIIVIIERLKGASLPGGVSLNFEEEIRDAKQLSREVESSNKAERSDSRPSIPLTEANARMLNLQLQPSPSGLNLRYYRNLAEEDPNIALAGLRIEVETLARNLAKGFKVKVGERDSAGTLLRRLHDNEAITSQQFELALKIVKLCNAAVHGKSVSLEEAESIIDVAKVLADQYITWLSWGFDDEWQPKDKEKGKSI